MEIVFADHLLRTQCSVPESGRLLTESMRLNKGAGRVVDMVDDGSADSLWKFNHEGRNK
jgi:hypothetical protein